MSQREFSPTAQQRGSSHSSCQETSTSSLIRAKINETEAIITKATQTRYILCRQLNDINDKTRVFPPEILSMIFVYVYDMSRVELADYVLTLGHVCSRWQDVTWSTPSLWRNLHLWIRATMRTTVLDKTLLHLKNIGHLTLKLNLRFSSCAFSEGWRHSLVFWRLHEILFNSNNSGKIGRLELFGHFPEREWVSYISSQFSRLEYLKVHPEIRVVPSNNTVEFHNIPSLSTLEIDNFGWDVSLSNTLEHITTLVLARTSITTCLQLLIACTNLVTFHCTNPSEGVFAIAEEDLDDFFPRTITFSRLEDIILDYHDNELWFELWDRVHDLSALRQFHWRIEPSDVFSSPGSAARQISTILGTSTSSLTALALNGAFTWNTEFIRELFDCIDGVEILDLTVGFTTLCGVYQALSPQGNERLLLPALKHLRISPALPGMKISPVSSIDLLRQRMGRKKTAFRLDIFHGWPLEVREILRELIKEGEWELELWDGDLVKEDWLY
ncbi:hypothetical protein D9756_004270 [Leucocoprinus leucothites]|uniref:F-box domain-containing protein n=1 Tax=Leucocoprinus leucothites TaxID=201217 RepID=A0A8H5G0Z0_9AGAR|nr:hypothetical protein D9756_004270 [Leucoagaricus leucothites]